MKKCVFYELFQFLSSHPPHFVWHVCNTKRSFTFLINKAKWHIYSRQSNDNRLCAQRCTEFLPFFLMNETSTCYFLLHLAINDLSRSGQHLFYPLVRAYCTHVILSLCCCCRFLLSLSLSLSLLAKTRKCFMHILWSERKNTKKCKRARKKWILAKLKLVIKVKWYAPVFTVCAYLLFALAALTNSKCLMIFPYAE